MGELTGKQKRYLRGLAHGLKPVVHIGKQGLSDALMESLGEALEHHELVKVKFIDFKEEKLELAAEIESKLDCENVGKIGHHVILYRQAREPEHRQIRLPKSSG